MQISKIKLVSSKLPSFLVSFFKVQILDTDMVKVTDGLRAHSSSGTNMLQSLVSLTNLERLISYLGGVHGKIDIIMF